MPTLRQIAAMMLADRRREVLDPSLGLHRTARFASGAIIPQAAFPSGRALRQVTFAITIKRTATSMNGVVWEIGGTTSGLALFVTDGVLGMAVPGSFEISAVQVPLNMPTRVVVSVRAGDGQYRVWMNGDKVISGGYTPGSGLLITNDGKVNGIEGTVISSVPAAAQASLTNCLVLSPLTVYANQLPIHFESAAPLVAGLSAVDLAGSADYFLRTGNPTGMTDNPKGLFSAWLRMDATSSSRNILTQMDGAFAIRCNAVTANKIDIAINTVGGGGTVNLTKTGVPTGQWVHLLASWDVTLGAGSRLWHFYVNGVNGTLEADVGSGGNVDYTGSAWRVGTNNYDGCIGEMAFWHNQYLDLSLETNRRKFITADNRPKWLGANGALPLGVQPILYFRDAGANFGKNYGSGGDFTATGDGITNCGNVPIVLGA